jgi:segregation and condensation protein B
MFATTNQFLDYFNLKSLQELPPLSEIKDLAGAEPEFDLTEELANSRILDMPDESDDDESRVLTAVEEAQLLAEEEAVELSKKPLDEILRMGVPEELLEKDRAEREALDKLNAEEEAIDDDESDEIDIDIGLSDDDIAVNEEFERNLPEKPAASDTIEEGADYKVAEDEKAVDRTPDVSVDGDSNGSADEVTSDASPEPNMI